MEGPQLWGRVSAFCKERADWPTSTVLFLRLLQMYKDGERIDSRELMAKYAEGSGYVTQADSSCIFTSTPDTNCKIKSKVK